MFSGQIAGRLSLIVALIEMTVQQLWPSGYPDIRYRSASDESSVNGSATLTDYAGFGPKFRKPTFRRNHAETSDNDSS